jgi:hypothetical protein
VKVLQIAGAILLVSAGWHAVGGAVYTVVAVATGLVAWRMVRSASRVWGGHADPLGELAVGVGLGTVWPVTFWAAIRTWWKDQCWP